MIHHIQGDNSRINSWIFNGNNIGQKAVEWHILSAGENIVNQEFYTLQKYTSKLNVKNSSRIQGLRTAELHCKKYWKKSFRIQENDTSDNQNPQEKTKSPRTDKHVNKYKIKYKYISLLFSC